MREVLRLKHRRYRTEEAYLSWVKRFILCHDKRHPQDMGAQEIRAFLRHLAVHEKVAASMQNNAFKALLFLYRRVLQHPCQNWAPLNEPNVRTVSLQCLPAKKCLGCWRSYMVQTVSWPACSTARDYAS